MEEDYEVGDDEYRLTLFSDIKKNFRDMKKTLYEKVSAALEDELCLVQESTEVQDISINSDDEEDTPLFERLQKNIVRNEPKKRTRGCREINTKKLRNGTLVPSSNQNSEVIILDDLDEVTLEQPILCNTSLDISDLNESVEIILDDDEDYEDENEEVSVKINWMNLKVHRFELRKKEKFTTVFEELSRLEDVPQNKILLILRDKISISRSDTPASLKLSIIDIIEGGIMSGAVPNRKEEPPPLDEDMLQFKCVLKNHKKPLMVAIKKTDTMYQLMVNTADQLQCPLDDLKFMFDGEPLNSELTVPDLELEGGEVFDVIRKQVA